MYLKFPTHLTRLLEQAWAKKRKINTCSHIPRIVNSFAMKILLQFTYSAIALVITANLSWSVGSGGKCTDDVRDIPLYVSIYLPIFFYTTNTVINFPRTTLEHASLIADINKSPFLLIATLVSPFILARSQIQTVIWKRGREKSIPLQARALLKDDMIGVCCGYVKCKEKNTGFNCMTEADCQGYTNQG